MTLREAYDAFCSFLNGDWPAYFNDALRCYIDKVDELIKENITLSVKLIKTQEKLRKERFLKEKYYKELRSKLCQTNAEKPVVTNE